MICIVALYKFICYNSEIYVNRPSPKCSKSSNGRFVLTLPNQKAHVCSVCLGRVATASTWLNYDVKFDLVYSYICMTASFESKLLTSTKREKCS